MKRSILTAAAFGALALAPVAAMAAPKFDLNPLLARTAPCTAVTNRGAVVAGACYEAFTAPGDWGGVFAGATWATAGAEQSVGGGLLSVALRADKVGEWAWARSGLGGRGWTMNFKLPRIKFGPTGGYASNAGGWFWGGFANVAFGG